LRACPTSGSLLVDHRATSDGVYETGGGPGSYIRHHLHLAGRDGDLFSDDALDQIHEASRGKPRTINNLALAALIATYAAGKKIVDQTAARAAISEVISAE
jgi:hypothetical protein